VATLTSTGITVVSPDGEVLDLIELDSTALPTNCCFDRSALWVTDFGRDYETVLGRGRLWRVETDAVGAPLATGAISPDGRRAARTSRAAPPGRWLPAEPVNASHATVTTSYALIIGAAGRPNGRSANARSAATA
jgi:hypothetical protein